MNPDRAVRILTNAIEADLASITTYLTAEWAEAIDSVPLATVAPPSVSSAMGLEDGCLWAEVVAALQEDNPERL
jgi:hypothetical protein